MRESAQSPFGNRSIAIFNECRVPETAYSRGLVRGVAVIDTSLPLRELQELFDALPDVFFFAKDAQCRYTHVNLTVVQRLGLSGRGDIVGKSVLELYPQTLANTYVTQDQRVLRGEVINNLLELQLYTNRERGWCLTRKQPVCNGNRVVGLIGISRDVGEPDGQHSSFPCLQRALAHMQAHFDEPARVKGLADLAGLSVAQLGRLFKRVFQLTPQQMLTRLRIEAAMRLLQAGASIAEVGQGCGFADHSAFSRQFKATVGICPREYRVMCR